MLLMSSQHGLMMDVGLWGQMGRLIMWLWFTILLKSIFCRTIFWRFSSINGLQDFIARAGAFCKELKDPWSELSVSKAVVLTLLHSLISRARANLFLRLSFCGLLLVQFSVYEPPLKGVKNNCVVAFQSQKSNGLCISTLKNQSDIVWVCACNWILFLSGMCSYFA